jgi:hypothetical protein
MYARKCALPVYLYCLICRQAPGAGGGALREGIHESTILLRFLGIILGFLRLKGSTFLLAFLQNSIHEQIQFSSLVDTFVWISETKGVV